MRPKNVLEKIEEKYDVASITFDNGRAIWPYLRQHVYFAIINKTIGYSNKLRTRNKKQLLKNFFYGAIHWFKLKRYDYLFLGNADKRIHLKEKRFDIYFDAWADKIGQDKSLFIEWAMHKHVPKREVYSKNVTSDLPLKLVSGIIKKLVKLKIHNAQILDNIYKEYGVQNCSRQVLKEKWAEYRCYRWLLKRTKPKAVFVLSGFTKVSIVAAAKDLGIPVVEAQHGYIGDSHPFYITLKQFDECYPDTLLSFGQFEKFNANQSLIFRPEQIIPVGSLQLELIKDAPINPSLNQRITPFKLVFCVTLQAIAETRILDWISQEAKDHPDWLFVLRPKDNTLEYSNYTKQKNVVRWDEYSIYEILKISHANITIFSTTAIEGQYLGAKPILINMDQMAVKYFDAPQIGGILLEEGDRLNEEDVRMKALVEAQFFCDDYFKNVSKSALCF